VRQAFVTYERLRRERVERVVEYSARIGKSKVAGPVTRFFRDLMMPLALKHFSNPNARAWLDQYHIDWNERIGEDDARTTRDARGVICAR
jgi:2-polyprenyl-6-methoxyphenol hydroxylase-like FAD-dependent oxidoreductase